MLKYYPPRIEGTRHNPLIFSLLRWIFGLQFMVLTCSFTADLQSWQSPPWRRGFQPTVEWVRLTRVKNSLPYEGKPRVNKPWSFLEDFSCDFRILHLIVSNPGGLVGFYSWTLILNGCLLLFIGRCTLYTYKMLQTLDILRPSFYFLTGAHKIELCHLTILKIKHLRRTVELVCLWSRGEVSGEKTQTAKEFVDRMCAGLSKLSFFCVGTSKKCEAPFDSYSPACKVPFDAFGTSHVLCHTSASVGTLAADLGGC